MNAPGRRNVLRMVRRALLLLILVPAARVGADGEVRLLTDDAIPRYLARGQELAKAEQWDKVVDVLHRIVIGDPEVFPDVKDEILRSAVYSADGRTFYPARELCLLELARLPPEGLGAYRDVHDAAARQLLAAADAVPEVEERLLAYAKVHDNFLPSSVGDDALEKAGDLSLALGRYYEALALFRRLIDVYPKDSDRDLPLVFAKAAYCAARIGDADLLAAILDRVASEYPAATVKVEGKAIPTAEIRDHPFFRRVGDEAKLDSDWTMPGGSPARSRSSPDLPEDLPRQPFWSFRLAERDSRLSAEWGRWRVVAHDREPSPDPPQVNVSAREHVVPYPTSFPIQHDGLLLYKDGREIVARRPGSGTLVPLVMALHAPTVGDDPNYKCPLYEVRPGTQDSVKDSAVIEGIYQYLDYGAADLLVTGGRILATDWKGPPHELRSEAGSPGAPNSLLCYSRATGQLVWGWEDGLYSEATMRDPASMDAWTKDFQLHRAASFFGTGVAAGSILYTLAAEREGEEPGTVSLWAFDLATGRVRFRTALHYDDEVAALLPRGAALATAGGTVYAVTQAGVVAAVDALPPGRVRWITRYAREYEGPQARSVRTGRIKETFAFNQPLVAEGKVIVAPADAKEVLALEAESGRVVWSIPKRALPAASAIVGVKDGLVFLSGDKVFAIDAAKGEVVWNKPLSAGFRYGRGFVGERYLHIPTYVEGATPPQSRVERFDLKTGQPADPLVFEVPRLGNLLCLDGRLIVANGREVMCFTSYEAEVARIDGALARPGARKAESYLERALVALCGGTKRRDQAREDFRRALEAASPAEAAQIRRHALDNLFTIAWEKNDPGALDEADRIVAPLREANSSPSPYEAQIALLRAEVLGHLGKGRESLDALEWFLDQFGHMRVVRGGRVVEGAAAGAALREQLQSQSSAFAAAFAETVRGRIEAAKARKDVGALKAILERYGNEPPAEEARFALADVYEAEGLADAAEAELRGFAEDHPQHKRVAVAHLRLARFYARQGKAAAASRERFKGVSRLDEAGRREHRALVAEIDELLRGTLAATKPPALKLPLAATPIALEGAAAVPVEGGLPDGLALFASDSEYIAVDPKGAVRWRAANPSRTGIPAGPDGEPTTAAIAGAVAAARFAVLREDGDLLLGDVAGLMRIEAKGGEVRWRYPEKDSYARDIGNAAMDLLREHLRLARTTGFAMRAHPLPSYLLADNVVVWVHPKAGVEAIHVGTGKVAWVAPDTLGQVAVGPPAAFGELIAVGFARPGFVRVLQTTDAAEVHTWRQPETALLAPPVIDPLGRLYVVSSAEKDGANGKLEIFDARSGESRGRYPVATANAAVLHADGKTLVYHDGSGGTVNLHCVDLETGKDTPARAPELLRSYHVLADRQRVFVLTSSPGLEDEGGRLYRIDPSAGEVLAYDYAVRASAFARPVFTEHHVAVAAVLARGAHVRLFDRDASAQSRGPQPLFVDPTGKETADLDFRPAGTTRLGAGIGIAPADGGLVVGHPWGAARLTQPAKGGG